MVMPFTGSHPAAVLPLIRLGLPPSALVIGSMAADLPYYLPIPVDSATTHSATGVLGVDLLIGLLSLVVWQTLVAPLAVAVAPSALRARLPPAAARWWLPGDLRRPLLVVVALVAGSATHVIWDEFTHVGRFGYRHLPWLAEPHGPLAGYRWAQYGSGVVGAVLILLALQRWWRAAPVSDPAPGSALSGRAVRLVLASVLLATLAGAVTGVGWAIQHDEGVRRALFLIATWGGGAGLVTVLVCAALARLARPRVPSASSLG
jgi:hypothetical protein